MNQKTKSLLIKFFALSLVIAVFTFYPEITIASVNLEASAQNLTGTTQKVGVALLTLSMVIGGIMMGAGSQKGQMMIVNSIIGGIVLFAAAAVIMAIRSSLN
jgi:hypothetical protein